MNTVRHASGRARQSFISVPVDGGVASMAWMNRVMPASTAGESSCAWVSGWPGPLPAKWFRNPNSTVAPELDWVGLVTHTVVFPDSTASSTSLTATSVRPVKPSRCISPRQPAYTTGVRNIGLTSCSFAAWSPICEKTELANQYASKSALPEASSRAWSTEPLRVNRQS